MTARPPVTTSERPSRRSEATRAELYEEARAREIPGRSNMTKAQLLAALEQREMT